MGFFFFGKLKVGYLATGRAIIRTCFMCANCCDILWFSSNARLMVFRCSCVLLVRTTTTDVNEMACNKQQKRALSAFLHKDNILIVFINRCQIRIIYHIYALIDGKQQWASFCHSEWISPALFCAISFLSLATPICFHNFWPTAYYNVSSWWDNGNKRKL